MPQREPALRWLRDCALTALVLALCTLTSWVFFRLDFVSSNYILTYIPVSYTLLTLPTNRIVHSSRAVATTDLHKLAYSHDAPTWLNF